MSRQSLLESYFKSNKVKVKQSLPKSIMNDSSDKVVLKRTLSLKKPVTPNKCSKLNIKDEPQETVIDLCSEDEEVKPSSGQLMQQEVATPVKLKDEVFDVTPTTDNFIITIPAKTSISTNEASTTTPAKCLTSWLNPKPSNDVTGYDSDSSQSTVVYSPPTTPQTPRRTPQTPTTAFKSPSSGKKYFSPIKKRAVSKKTPVKRNLALDLNECSVDNDLFNEACSGMDDKTIFLLNIINRCICKPSLYKLLDENAQSLLSKSMHVQKPGMRLVCRLYWHKQGWYKLDKIRSLLNGVAETIDDPTLYGALNSLQEHGFLKLGGIDSSISFDEFANILSGPELKQLCKELKLKMNSKQDAIAALRDYSKAKSIHNFFSGKTNDNSMRVLKIMSSKAGPCYKLSDVARQTIHDLYILMYLGMNYNVIREKNLELTLLYDKIKRETYPVDEEMLDDASVVFKERDEFKSYLKAHNIREDYLAETDSTKKCDMVTKVFDDFKDIQNTEMLKFKSLPVWLRHYTPLYIYVKILEEGIHDLKRDKRYGLVLEILDALISLDTWRQHKKAKWYAEKALVLDKCSRPEEAAQVLLEGFNSDFSEEAKDHMRPRAKIYARQKCKGLNEEVRAQLLEHATKDDIMEKKLRGVHVYKQPMDKTKQTGKLKFETRTSGERIVQDVEEYCLSHYISSGKFTDGMHWEGRIITTWFFLLFWDIIYWRPPECVGVFLTRFQRYPLDLFSESFYANRRDCIEARLALIERSTIDEVIEIMRVRWFERPESEVSGLPREAVRWEGAAAAARGLGARALAALCRRVAADYRYAHSAFPDLTLWNTHTNQIRFVEVKSDTDKPSMKQIQWMHYLQRHGIDTEFCYVGVNTTRCKARAVD